MAWIYLFIAGTFEVAWAIGLKQSNTFTRLYPSIFTVVSMIVSFYFLSLASKSLPMGTAYAIWTGIGAVGVVVIGMIFFNEPHDMTRIIFLFLIVAGIIGLKLTAGTP
jgi:quaternary ammonium compound-resistance protein SugE